MVPPTPEAAAEQGYGDGFTGQDAHPPMEGADKLRDAYQRGYERGKRDGLEDRDSHSQEQAS